MVARLILLMLVIVPVPVPRRAPAPYWQALRAWALDWEIVGPQERWIEDFNSEVGYVRRHLHELSEAPSLQDVKLLPPRQVVLMGRVLNLEYQRTLELRRRTELHHAEALEEALAEARRVGEVWCLLDAATNETNSWVCRRRALASLRDLLGPDAYYSGRRPGPVPGGG